MYTHVGRTYVKHQDIFLDGPLTFVRLELAVELQAATWDQRSQTRADEIQVLTQARLLLSGPLCPKGEPTVLD